MGATLPLIKKIATFFREQVCKIRNMLCKIVQNFDLFLPRISHQWEANFTHFFIMLDLIYSFLWQLFFQFLANTSGKEANRRVWENVRSYEHCHHKTKNTIRNWTFGKVANYIWKEIMVWMDVGKFIQNGSGWYEKGHCYM